MQRLAIATAVSVLAALPAAALQPLHQNPTVVNGFYAIGLADELRKNCESIEPRWLRAYNYLKALEKFARDAGYSDAEIDQLVDNKSEKERLRDQIQDDLAQRGASRQTPEGYCTVGREEIAKNSAAGRLLREK